MSPRRRIIEGDPVAPIAQTISAGLHERDVYIAAALASTPESMGSATPEAIADRAVAIADAVMERKERT